MSGSGVKISDLPVLPSVPTGTEPVPLVRGGVTYQAPSDYLDNLAPSLPYAQALTGDEIVGIEQVSENVLATLNDQLRLVAARRAGLVFDNIEQAQAQVSSLGLQDGDVITVAAYALPQDSGGGLYERVAFEPSLPGKFQDISGAWWQLQATVSNPEQFGAIGDGISDDTAAFTAAAQTADIVEMRADRKYRLNSWKPGSKCLVLGTKGSSISKVAGADCAIDISSGFVTLQNVLIDNEVFDANGDVDPARAGTSVMTAFGTNTITVTAGHGVRFKAGMTAFWDSAIDAGVGDTGRISNVSGDVLTFDRDFDYNPIVGSKIIADFPVIKLDVGTFAATIQNIVMRRFVAGLRTGGTLSSAGNAWPQITGIRAEAYTGASIIQMDSMAAEMFSNLTLGGTNTVRRTYTAEAGQAAFVYGYNVTPYRHRGGDGSSIGVTVNGVSVDKASLVVDMTTVTVTIPTPCAGGETVIVSNTEWSPRGILCDGVDGSVSGMGRITNVVALGHAVGCHVRGGSAGVQFLALDGATIDTSSYAGVMLENVNRVEMWNCALWFAPYSLRIIGPCQLIKAVTLSTTVMSTVAIGDLALRPNRSNIYVDPAAISVVVCRGGWVSASDTVYDPGSKIVWTPHTTLMEAGTNELPALAFRLDPDTGWYWDEATGAWKFSANAGVTPRLTLSATGAGFYAGTAGVPGAGFAGTTSGLRRASGNSSDRWLVDGNDRWFWGAYDVGPLSVPLRLPTFTVTVANNLTNLTDGGVIYVSNGNAGAPCLAVRSGGAWLRVPLGAAISSVS